MTKKRILYMDDDTAMRSFITHALEHRYDITTVASPRQAINTIQEHKFDLLIFDHNINESDMDGASTAEVIRSMGIETPVGLLTVYSREELNTATQNKLKKLKHLAFYQIKPVATHDLYDLIEKSVGN